MSASARITEAVNTSRRALGVSMIRGGAGAVGVLVLPGVSMPDGVQLAPSGDGCYAGAVDLDRARELVTLRAPAAASRLDQAPPVGNRWCLVIDVRGVVLVPFTVPGKGSPTEAS